jgi:rare lipoprotein A
MEAIFQGTFSISRSLVFAAMMLSVASCSKGTKAQQPGQWILGEQTGDATYYAARFQGNTTASGRTFDNRKAVAAHRSYPFGTVARVTNLRNRRVVNVVIIDRGPYGRNYREGAIIDLSRAAATGLDMIRDGQVKVKVEVLAWGTGQYVRNSD